MHPYSDTGCEIVWLCVKPCQMCRVQTRTALACQLAHMACVAELPKYVVRHLL
jgi:hypothetical protein